MSSVILGDCVDVMATMDADSFDAIVTDPPYGLEFMGKEWDRLSQPGIGARPTDWVSFSSTSRNALPNRTCGSCGGRERGAKKCACAVPDWKPIGPRRSAHDAPDGMTGGGMARQLHAMQGWHEAWAREAYRVAKPGAHLLAFGGTRTYHRLTCALEDAGWEIRDCLVWAYASGFPKSLDVSKAIDKAAGHWRGRAGAVTVAVQPSKGTEYERTPKGDPLTAEAVRWAGWGTALKPAWEPIVLARKPLRGTVAANVQQYGTGAINVDATRIPLADGDVEFMESRMPAWNRKAEWDGPAAINPGPRSEKAPAGRWPPNLLLTDAELFDVRNDGVVGSGAIRVDETGWHHCDDPSAHHAAGGYARFFLVPKASRSDREPVWGEELAEGMVGGRSRNDGRQWDIPGSTLDNGKPRRKNTHPTTKPVDLMRHLVRLVTPPGGRILDPFLGSGTTLIAAEMEGFEGVGIEKDESYVAIANARLNGVQRGLGLTIAAPLAREKRPAVERVDLELFPGMAGPAEGDEVA